jgi:transcription-repair coupling factor (superfamily II helicase)
MSLVGIRDMSVLEEAPNDRLPIQTYFCEYNDEMVREAIVRELSRNGQVYYVYNWVDDIERVTLEHRAHLPNARIEFGHGKMKERELENIMHAFINKEIDVLVSTTIIETGLDIPNVNTIIIHNADNFGLSQLYQLRGRVGRSDRSSFAFLMYRRDKVIKEVAEKRLSAIREFTELGSGYKISMKDLEIRGAGNVLGSSQSGDMEEIGYDLYVKLLGQAIRSKMGDKVEEDFDTSVDIPVDAYIPDEYVRNEYLKLEMYKRISHIESQDDIDDIMREAEDRFGEVPKTMQRLMRVAYIKELAHSAYITFLRYRNDSVEYIIKDGAPIDVAKITSFIKKYKGTMRLINAKESGFAVKTSSLVQDSMLSSIEKVIEDIYDNLIIKEEN